MKTLYLPAIVCLFISCQKPKNWECSCDVTTSSGSATKTKEITNTKKRDANEECADYGKRLIGGNGKYVCKITEK
ncbi:MAG: hypothetical protein JNL60_04980 [Bacteroidia bacterium]|nr:hypothetical protein [Bacteroidia bacterium]